MELAVSMSKPFHRSPDERLSVLLFFALFSVALGLLSTLFSCTTDYWLLGSAKLCHPGSGSRETEEADSMLFHEGLFWRCSFPATSPKYSLWDLWILKAPHIKVCQAAFLFPFPANNPFWVQSPDSPAAEPYEHHSAIVFRTFWSIFLITGVATVTTGGLAVICTAALSKHKFYKVGGVLLICGGLCLLAVVLMYVMWVHVLDTLEEFARGQQVSGCKSFHLSIQHGPSFQLAPVASFFSLLSGLLFLLIAQGVRSLEPHRTHKTPHPPELQTDL
ncbi:transmembrane protein 182-like [Hippocampus zosterae]|uniref:transmembrane protein 182-like n=1 Tax=Hippocampus zosterae TaxID=109293 RepID=UPI00223C9D65|nr:transmembrane protein 182-like [Hippocampus zosterae]